MNWPNPAASTNYCTHSGSPLYSSNELTAPPCPREVATLLYSKQDQIERNASVHMQSKFKKQYSQILRHSTIDSSYSKALSIDFNYPRHIISRIQLSRHFTNRSSSIRGVSLVHSIVQGILQSSSQNRGILPVDQISRVF